jgi:hypothetical protein
MKIFIASCLFTGLAFFSCSPKKPANEEVKADSVSQPSQTSEMKDDSNRTLVLKWKSISSSEWGPSYEFTDEAGNDFIADRLNIEGFSEDSNEYFFVKQVDDTPMSQYEMRDGITNNWYDVKIKTIQEESDAGDGSMKDVQVVVSIKPH